MRVYVFSMGRSAVQLPAQRPKSRDVSAGSQSRDLLPVWAPPVSPRSEASTRGRCEWQRTAEEVVAEEEEEKARPGSTPRYDSDSARLDSALEKLVSCRSSLASNTDSTFRLPRLVCSLLIQPRLEISALSRSTSLLLSTLRVYTLPSSVVVCFACGSATAPV